MKCSLNISVHLSMKIILVDLNLVRTFFGTNFFDRRSLKPYLVAQYLINPENETGHGKM